MLNVPPPEPLTTSPLSCAYQEPTKEEKSGGGADVVVVTAEVVVGGAGDPAGLTGPFPLALIGADDEQDASRTTVSARVTRAERGRTGGISS
jgi:hypothetical protein